MCDTAQYSKERFAVLVQLTLVRRPSSLVLRLLFRSTFNNPCARPVRGGVVYVGFDRALESVPGGERECDELPELE